MTRKVFKREDVAKIAPSQIGVEYAGRYYLPKSAPKDLEKLIVQAKGAGLSKDTLRLAWFESLENKLKEKKSSKEDDLSFQDALEVYFEKLSYYDMNRYEVAFNNFVNA